MVVTENGSCAVIEVEWKGRSVVDTVEVSAISSLEESVMVSVEVTRSLFVVNPEESLVLDAISVSLFADVKPVDVSNIVDKGSVETPILIVDDVVIIVESCARMDVSLVNNVLDRTFVVAIGDAIPFEVYSELDGESDVEIRTVALETSLVVSESIGV